MNGSRDHVLSRLRVALGRDAPTPGRRKELELGLKAPRAGVIPVRAMVNGEARADLFMEEARRVEATVVRVPAQNSTAAAIAAYLTENDLPKEIKAAPHPDLKKISWADQPGLTVREGRAQAHDPVGLSAAYAGIAETGTLVLLSGPASPVTLNFLPDTHIVVLPTDRIHGAYEDVWAALRAKGPGFMPRTVNWITGPSRTADIEQSILLGAHGPRRLHIVLTDGPC